MRSITSRGEVRRFGYHSKGWQRPPTEGQHSRVGEGARRGTRLASVENGLRRWPTRGHRQGERGTVQLTGAGCLTDEGLLRFGGQPPLPFELCGCLGPRTLSILKTKPVLGAPEFQLGVVGPPHFLD